MVSELPQNVEGMLATDPRGRLHGGRGLPVVELIRSRKEIQHDRARPGQLLRRFEIPWRDQTGRPFLRLAPHRRRQHGGVFQTGGGEKVQPGADLVIPRVVSPLEQPADQRGPFLGTTVTHGHPDHVLPLGVSGMLRDLREVLGLDRRLRSEVVLEGAVDEVDGLRGGFAQQAAAAQQVAEDIPRPFGRGHTGHGGQQSLDQPDHPVLLRLGLAVADQPPGELLEELTLRVLRDVEALRGAHIAFLVAADKQHGQRRTVQLHPALRQIGTAVAVQRADHRAHQRVGGEPGQVPLAAQGVQQALGVPVPLRLRTGLGALPERGQVPAPYECLNVLPVHREQIQFGEVPARQPALAHGGGAGGDDTGAVRVGGEQRGEPLLGPLTVAFGDLVHAVDEEQRTPVAHHPLRPTGRLAERSPGGGQELPGAGQLAVPDECAERQHEGHAVVEMAEPVAEGVPGGRDGQPLDEGGLP